jgi:NTE family protein
MLFKPVEIDGELFADGGLFSSVPVQTVKKMGADIIIAVQLNKYLDIKQSVQHLNIMEVGELALQIVERKIADDEVSHADFTIRPQLARIHWKDFIQQEARENGVLLGEKAAQGFVVQIKMRVAENNISRAIKSWVSKIKGLFSADQ